MHTQGSMLAIIFLVKSVTYQVFQQESRKSIVFWSDALKKWQPLVHSRSPRRLVQVKQRLTERRLSPLARHFFFGRGVTLGYKTGTHPGKSVINGYCRWWFEIVFIFTCSPWNWGKRFPIWRIHMFQIGGFEAINQHGPWGEKNPSRDPITPEKHIIKDPWIWCLDPRKGLKVITCFFVMVKGEHFKNPEVVNGV